MGYTRAFLHPYILPRDSPPPPGRSLNSQAGRWPVCRTKLPQQVFDSFKLKMARSLLRVTGNVPENLKVRALLRGRTQRDKPRFSLIFADSCLFLENKAYGKRRFSQKAADFCREAQKTARTADWRLSPPLKSRPQKASFAAVTDSLHQILSQPLQAQVLKI